MPIARQLGRMPAAPPFWRSQKTTGLVFDLMPTIHHLKSKEKKKKKKRPLLPIIRQTQTSVEREREKEEERQNQTQRECEGSGGKVREARGKKGEGGRERG